MEAPSYESAAADLLVREPIVNSDSDDDAPLARKKPNGKRAGAASSSDEDRPLVS